MKIGNIRPQGEFLADTWQRVYSNTIVEVVDQSSIIETDGNAIGDLAGSELRQAQIFKLDSAQQISAVEVKRFNDTGGAPTGNWTLRIETVSGGVPTGTLADANASIVVTPPAVNTIIKGTFVTPFTLSGSTSYALVIQCDNQSDNTYWKLCSSNTSVSPYENGTRCYSINGSWSAADNDLYFKIYTGGKVTSLTISGLDGDTAEEYILRIKIIGGSLTSGYYLLRPNADNGANYGEQYLVGYSDTKEAGRYTNNTGIYLCGFTTAQNSVTISDILLYAKSGYVRTGIVKTCNSVATTTINHIWQSGESWNNTADNITSLVITASVANGLGVGSVIELYAKRSKI